MNQKIEFLQVKSIRLILIFRQSVEKQEGQIEISWYLPNESSCDLIRLFLLPFPPRKRPVIDKIDEVDKSKFELL